MDNTALSLLLAVIGSLSGIAALISVIQARRKAPAEIAKIEAETGLLETEARKIELEVTEKVTLAYRTFADDLRAQITGLQQRVSQLEESDRALRESVETLEAESRAWKRRFARVCRHTGMEPKQFITRPLGSFDGE